MCRNHQIRTKAAALTRELLCCERDAEQPQELSRNIELVLLSNSQANNRSCLEQPPPTFPPMNQVRIHDLSDSTGWSIRSSGGAVFLHDMNLGRSSVEADMPSNLHPSSLLSDPVSLKSVPRKDHPSRAAEYR